MLSILDKRPFAASSPALNLPDMLQELDPETLAMLENEDAKSDSLLTSLSFDDILSSISITPSSGDELNQEKAACPSGSFCSSESSPPSLPESFVSSASCNRTDQNHQTQSQQKQQSHQQSRDTSLLSDVEIDTDLPSDSDEFWDAFVTSRLFFPPSPSPKIVLANNLTFFLLHFRCNESSIGFIKPPNGRLLVSSQTVKLN